MNIEDRLAILETIARYSYAYDGRNLSLCEIWSARE